jgi:hypothetical protein
MHSEPQYWIVMGVQIHALAIFSISFWYSLVKKHLHSEHDGKEKVLYRHYQNPL